MKELKELVRPNIWSLAPYSSARNEYAGHTAHVFLDANENPYNKPYIEGYKDPSVLHHFYHKLFKLGDNMNTKTAKKIARKRIEFMKEFTDEFLNEWDSKF